jgi:succinoglycan biosynthesis protein ExoA
MSDPTNIAAPGAACLIVVPTLNERQNLAHLLDALLIEAAALDARIVVADGGSTDGTIAIARDYAAHFPRVAFIDNPRRIQSAAMNLAVARFGAAARYVIRVDAHGYYPADYCRRLVAEAERTGAGGVVVPMLTVGRGVFQRAVANAQNSLVGTGGSSHRTGRTAGWVDHGHHALMRIAAYRAVGGYDEAFRYNEDAELDHRLGAAGWRIWLTDATLMVYFPRATPLALFRQYFGYGGGRARNILKHHTIPRIRQMLPLAILPAVALAGLALVNWLALVPLLAWSLLCLGMGTLAATRSRHQYRLPLLYAPLAGLAAMIMHFAWSAGFWLHVATSANHRRGVSQWPA